MSGSICCSLLIELSDRKAICNLNRTEVKMDDLPELPFEKVLSHLSLEDVLKSRAVCRRWYDKINGFKVNSLCYSDHPIELIRGSGRFVSGAFAKNFISSPRF